MKTFFRIAAVLLLLLGIAWVFLPRQMLSSWGAQPEGVAVYLGRRYGGLFFGYATILWLSRAAAPSRARSAILAGGAVVTTVMTFLSLFGLLSGAVGPVLWSAVVIEAALAVGFVYFLATNPE